MPHSTLSPRYHDVQNFWPVIIVFALFDSAYFAFSSIFILNMIIGVNDRGNLYEIATNIYMIPLSLFIIVFGLHFILYKEYANFREYGYLKSNLIGIDIDGVLNKQREHFCNLLKLLNGIVIDPAQITHIPVHELFDNVTREHEYKVFNSPEYWLNMPRLPDISANIKKLKNSLNLNIIIFTYRPWPDLTTLSCNDRKLLKREWKSSIVNYVKNEVSMSKINKLIEIIKIYSCYAMFPARTVNKITKLWLKVNGVLYDKLIIEKGNENIPSARSKIVNRIQMSGKKRIKYFIEDDLEKAVKLSYLCDIVFLMKHPYNQNRLDIFIPPNVIIVENWNEIYRKIRLML